MAQPRLPPLNALKTLEAVHETGSISAAAKQLSVSHSAVSHQIKVLQEWIGRPIIVRKGRSVSLTPAGESLAMVVRKSFDAIRHEMDLVPLRFKRSVSLTVSPVIAQEIILPNLPDFHKNSEGITLHISLELADHPRSTSPDIEIGFGRLAQLSQNDRVFMPGTAVLVAAPSLLARYDHDPEKTLRHAPRISDEDARMWPRWLGRPNTETDVNPIVYCEGSFLMQRAAIEGLGIAINRKATLTRALDAGELVILSDREIDDDWAYILRCAPNVSSEPEVAKVLSWLETLS